MRLGAEAFRRDESARASRLRQLDTLQLNQQQPPQRRHRGAVAAAAAAVAAQEATSSLEIVTPATVSTGPSLPRLSPQQSAAYFRFRQLITQKRKLIELDWKKTYGDDMLAVAAGVGGGGGGISGMEGLGMHR